MKDIIGSSGDSKPILVRPEEALKAMEEAFPDKLPMNPSVTIEDLRYLQGQRSVLQWFKSFYMDD